MGGFIALLPLLSRVSKAQNCLLALLHACVCMCCACVFCVCVCVYVRVCVCVCVVHVYCVY